MEIAPDRGWRLISVSYCRAETSKNIGKLGAEAVLKWPDMQAKVDWVPNALTSRKPLRLAASKDKPVLISALAAECEVLLTLDKGDFGILLGTVVYGLRVDTPRDFLIAEGLG